jgi:hypothetical protein
VNDNGAPITLDMMLAWNDLGTPQRKHVKFIHTFLITDGNPQPYLDINFDYNYAKPQNQPVPIAIAQGTEWDVAYWDVTDWAKGAEARRIVNGVRGMGNVLAVRFRCAVDDCAVGITGFSIVYEPGAFL